MNINNILSSTFAHKRPSGCLTTMEILSEEELQYKFFEALIQFPIDDVDWG
jgi:hypothetical protein